MESGTETPDFLLWISKISGRRCDRPWTHTTIEVNGAIHPCYSYSECMGNLRDQSWQEIWNGPAYRRFRRLMSTWNPSAVCRVCPYAFGISGGDAGKFDRYFDRFTRRPVPLDSPEIEFDDGFHALERSGPDSSHRWMSRVGGFTIPAPPDSAFLRLRVFQRLPTPETNGGVCVVDDAPPEPFDNSAPLLHFPVPPGPVRRVAVRIEMEKAHRVDEDPRELALGLSGIEWLSLSPPQPPDAN